MPTIGAFSAAEQARKNMNILSVKAECNLCHNVQVVKIDNPDLVHEDFGADCKICKDRTSHHVMAEKPEKK